MFRVIISCSNGQLRNRIVIIVHKYLLFNVFRIFGYVLVQFQSYAQCYKVHKFTYFSFIVVTLNRFIFKMVFGDPFFVLRHIVRSSTIFCFVVCSCAKPRLSRFVF